MGYCEHVMEVIILFAFSFIGWNPTLTQSNLYQIIFSPKSIPCHAFKRVLGFGVGVGWAQFLGCLVGSWVQPRRGIFYAVGCVQPRRGMFCADVGSTQPNSTCQLVEPTGLHKTYIQALIFA